MRVLLDTQAFLWWSLDDDRLPVRVRRVIGNPENELLLSIASCWEIAIKVRIGKLHLPEPLETYLPQRLAHHRVELLPVALAHTIETASLPLHHGDPFDRLLIAQSRIEGVPLVTSDAHFKRYPIKVIW